MPESMHKLSKYIVWLGGFATGIQFLVYLVSGGVALMVAAFVFLFGETPLSFRVAIFAGLSLILFAVFNHLLGLFLAWRKGRFSTESEDATVEPTPPDTDSHQAQEDVIERLGRQLQESEREREELKARIASLDKELEEAQPTEGQIGKLSGANVEDDLRAMVKQLTTEKDALEQELRTHGPRRSTNVARLLDPTPAKTEQSQKQIEQLETQNQRLAEYENRFFLKLALKDRYEEGLRLREVGVATGNFEGWLDWTGRVYQLLEAAIDRDRALWFDKGMHSAAKVVSEGGERRLSIEEQSALNGLLKRLEKVIQLVDSRDCPRLQPDFVGREWTSERR